MLLCAVPEITPTIPSLAERFVRIAILIRDGLANRGKSSPIPGPFAVLIWRRIDALRDQILAALLRGPITRRAAQPNPPCQSRPNRPQAAPKPNLTHPDFIDPCRDFQLPTHQGWLLRMLPCPDIAIARYEVITLLDDPALRPLITPYGALAQSLRAFCTLLNIPRPDMLRRPPRAKTPKSPKPPKPRKPRTSTRRRYPPPVPIDPNPRFHRPFTWDIPPQKTAF